MPAITDVSYRFFKLFIVILLSMLAKAKDLEQGKCDAPQGMESGEIPDEDISASSMFDPSLGPKYARLHQDRSGGAWCPKNLATDEGKEYLEINLRRLRFLTSTATQGRYGNGHGVEYTEDYYVEYWRPGFIKWRRWKNRRGLALLSGNDNPQSEKKQIFDPPIIATKIRFVPYSAHIRTVCMRVELYGCSWTDGVVSYSMPQGVQRGSEVDLTDRTYDREDEEESGFLSDGLGQLTDRIKGPDNFRLDLGNGKGYEWVGWKNDTPNMLGQPLEIIFEFDFLRNFTAMHLHSNNFFSREVQVFSQAKVYVSEVKNQFVGEPVHFTYVSDLVLEQARDVTIKLHSRTGRYIKLQLYFAASWIMLSEITFDSVVAEWNVTEERVIKIQTTSQAPQISTSSTQNSTLHNTEAPLQRDEVKAIINKDEIPDKSKEQESRQFIGFVIGILTTVILMLLAAITLIFYRNRRLKAALSPMTFFDQQRGGLKVTMDQNFDKGPICPPLPLQYDPCNYANLITTSNIITAKTAISPTCVISTTALTNPHFHKIVNGKDYSGKEDYQPIPLILSTPLSLSQQISTIDPTKAPPVPPPPEIYYSNSSLRKSPPLPPLPPTPTPSTPLQMSIKASNSLSSNSLEDMLTEDDEDVEIFDFPRERLNIVENLGFGYFGETHICEVDNFPDREKLFQNTCTDSVIVKSLKPGSSESLRLEFQKEAKRLSRLNDRNITRVLGASLADDPMCIILENTELGDLNQFLQNHLAETSTVKNAKTLSFGTLIYMATQVASGMKYLEEKDFVHRDLAARNCLVSKGHIIKVSDLGPGRSAYVADYFKLENRQPLPIRWMAWESMLMDTYTSKSDVWAFAVTFWEILTFAREQPFEELPDHRIIANATFFYQEDDKKVILPLPKNCPKEIYDLMCECWQRNDTDRPNFREIHLFLQRKNLGYKPNRNDT